MCGGIDTMRQRTIVLIGAVTTLGLGDLTVTNTAQAGIFDMMNPSRWFSDYDRDYYRGWGYGPGRYGYGGPWGHPWGGGWGGYPGWGGWGYPGYGYHAVVAPAAPATQQAK